MTMPSGDDPSGINTDGHDGSVIGAGFSALASRTEANVKAAKKSEIEGNSILNSVLDMLFDGLDRALGLPMAILTSFLHKMFPWIPQVSSVTELVSHLEEVPLLGPLITALSGGLAESFEELQTMFGNLMAFLGSINPLSPNFNLTDAATSFITLVLSPVNLLAKLVGGLIPGINIPILDPTKILGLPSLFTDFGNLVNGVVTGSIGTITGAIGSFLSALFGFGSGALPAYKPENAAIANVQGQVNFLLADSDPSTSGFFEGFNTPPTLNSTWTNIFGPMDAVHPDGVFWHTAGYNAKRYNAARPGTTHWQVQGSIAYVANHGGLAGRLICGLDPANWNTRYPAIEVLSVGGPSDTISLVSMAGNPNSVANANIGRTVLKTASYGAFIIKNGDVVALECNEATGMYSLYLNPGPASVPILTYDDSTANVFTRGVGHRDVAAQINVNNIADPFQGAGWDNIAAFDRTA